MLKILTSIALLLALLWGIPSAQATEEIVMVFGSNLPFIPHGKADGTDNNLSEGIFIDFLEEFEKQHPEYHIKKVRLPRERLNEWMRTGEADAFALNSPLFTKDKDKSQLDFSKPIWRTGDHLIVLKDSSITSTNIQKLVGKTLGVIHGNGYGPLDPYLKSGKIKSYQVYCYVQLYKMLIAGRIDGYVGNRHTEWYARKRQKHDFTIIRKIEPALYEFDLVVVVQKKRKDFLRTLNAFIVTSQQNGFLETLTTRYLGQTETE